jgi:hypothetical protein
LSHSTVIPYTGRIGPAHLDCLHREEISIARNTTDGRKSTPTKASMMGGFLFFRYLQDERSDLLDFRAVGDEKWQIVHGWLRDRLED